MTGLVLDGALSKGRSTGDGQDGIETETLMTRGRDTWITGKEPSRQGNSQGKDADQRTGLTRPGSAGGAGWRGGQGIRDGGHEVGSCRPCGL